MLTSAEGIVLDQEVLERLRSLEESGDPALLEELIRDFGQLTPHRLVELRENAMRMDLVAVAGCARALEDSARTLGLVRMRHAAESVAAVAENAAVPLLVPAITALERRFVEAHEALEAYELNDANA